MSDHCGQDAVTNLASSEPATRPQHRHREDDRWRRRTIASVDDAWCDGEVGRSGIAEQVITCPPGQAGKINIRGTRRRSTDRRSDAAGHPSLRKPVGFLDGKTLRPGPSSTGRPTAVRQPPGGRGRRFPAAGYYVLLRPSAGPEPADRQSSRTCGTRWTQQPYQERSKGGSAFSLRPEVEPVSYPVAIRVSASIDEPLCRADRKRR